MILISKLLVDRIYYSTNMDDHNRQYTKKALVDRIFCKSKNRLTYQTSQENIYDGILGP